MSQRLSASVFSFIFFFFYFFFLKLSFDYIHHMVAVSKEGPRVLCLASGFHAEAHAASGEKPWAVCSNRFSFLASW